MLSFGKKEIRKSAKSTDASFQNFVARAVGLIKRQGEDRDRFIFPQFDLEEIKIAIEADSYIKQAVTKYTYLIYKAGYKLDSENKDAMEYIKKRLRIISFATEKPFDLLMQEIGEDLYRFSNAFLIKSRKEWTLSTIEAHPIGDSDIDPVVGYYRVDPSTISIKRDEYGQVEEYRQIVNGKEKKYKPHDVIHMYFDKGPNDSFGTPRLASALEDVKLLRKIEGNVISLIYRFSLPIYHWKVGLPTNGQTGSQKEIDKLKYELEKMANDGSIVTNERVDVATIGAEGAAIDVTNYLAYFEARAFAALGVSPSQMGRGATGTNADAMESQAHDTIKFVQRVISMFVENEIINELLLEGGFDPILNEDDIVQYIFNEISLDTKVKIENHEMLKYQSNMITLEEARRAIGKKEDVDEDRLYARIITDQSAINTIEAQTEGQLSVLTEQAKVNEAAAEKERAHNEKMADKNAQAQKEASEQKSPEQNKNNGNGTVKSNSPNKDASTRNRPTNQHGTTSVKIRESLVSKEDTDKKVARNRKDFQSVYKKFDLLRTDIERGVENKTDLKDVVKVGTSAIIAELDKVIDQASQEGSTRCLKEAGESQIGIRAIPKDEARKHVRDKVNGLFKDILAHIKDGVTVEAAFDALEYRFRFMLTYIIPKTYWYSYAQTARQLKIKTIYVQFGESEDKELHKETISTNRILFDEIPAYHPYCSCTLGLREEQ